MKRALSLFTARNKEYYRDRGALVWSFVMPPLIILVVALAFSRGEQPIFTIGVMSAENQQWLEDKSLSGTKIIFYEDKQKAITKVQHHQIDMLLGDQKYWINPSSQSGDLMIKLLGFEGNDTWQAQSIEGRKIRYIDWAIPGILSMNIMFSSLFGIGYVIVRYRKNGVLKRLQASPVKPIEFLSAQAISRLIIVLAVMTIVYVVANFALDFLMLGSYFTLFVIAALGTMTLLSLGLIVASRLSSEELASGILNFMSFPMMLLSELWFSLDGAPPWMSAVSQALPLTHMTQAARAVMLDGAGFAEISHHLTVLSLMTVVFLFIAATLFRWSER
jgi:ABC-type multidrug transport system permease subunit